MLADYVVGHSSREQFPHLTWSEKFCLPDSHSQKEQLFHRLVEASPLLAVLVIAGIQKRHSSATRLLEIVREFVEHGLDFSFMAFQPSKMESDITSDSFDLDMVDVVITVLEQTVEEYLGYPFCSELLGHVISSFDGDTRQSAAHSVSNWYRKCHTLVHTKSINVQK